MNEISSNTVLLLVRKTFFLEKYFRAMLLHGTKLSLRRNLTMCTRKELHRVKFYLITN